MKVYTPFSLRFWRALQRPPVYHSLFRRVAQQYFEREVWTPFWFSWTKNQQILSTGVLVFVGLLSIFTVPQLLTIMIFIVPIVGTLIYIMMHGTLTGLQQCWRVSSLIARARERGMFDLLALAPLGGFGITWTLCTGSLYYETSAGGSTAGQRVWISRILFLAVVMLITLMTLASPRTTRFSPSGMLTLSLITVGLVGFAFWLDDMLSSVIGILVGLIIPTATTGVVYTRVVAAVVFLLLQLAAYLLTWLISFVMLPELAAGLLDSAFWAELLVRLAQVGTLFLVRDALARGLWLVFRRRMEDQVLETAILMRGLPHSA